MSENENQLQNPQEEPAAKKPLFSFANRAALNDQDGDDGKKKKKKKTWQRELLEWVVTLVVALVIAFVVRSFLFEPVYVDGNSMYPTLRHGEIMYVSKTSYGSGFFGIPFTSIGKYFNVGGNPGRFDVVVCHYADQDYNVVKRVVGLPGDTVELRDGLLYVTDAEGVSVGGYTFAGAEKAIDEDFIHHKANHPYGPFTVPKKGDYVATNGSAIPAEALETGVIILYETRMTDVNGKTLTKLPEGVVYAIRRDDGVLCRANGIPFGQTELDKLNIVIPVTSYTDMNGNPIAESDLPENAILATICEEDQYFLMGDNRSGSLDSREKGTVARSEIVGKVEGVLWHTIPNRLDDRYGLGSSNR